MEAAEQRNPGYTLAFEKDVELGVGTFFGGYGGNWKRALRRMFSKADTGYVGED